MILVGSVGNGSSSGVCFVIIFRLCFCIDEFTLKLKVHPCIAGTSDKGVVEVTNCFCVPHKEHADQVEAELNYALDVYELNRRVNASENIVGESTLHWKPTATEIEPIFCSFKAIT